MNATFIIKTLERPDSLARLLRSIRLPYPGVRILVGDDSADHAPAQTVCQAWEAEHVAMEHDVGLGAGRNRLADLVDSEELVLCDDDFQMLPDSNVEPMLSLVRSGMFDLCGGTVCHFGQETHFEGRMWLEPGTLNLKRTQSPCGDPVAVDITWNFFVANTKMVQEVRWDDRLKVAEHHDFFLTAAQHKANIGYYPRTLIDHRPENNAAYAQYRHTRNQEFWEVVQKKWGFTQVKGNLTG